MSRVAHQSTVDWAESKTVGVVSELTLLTPIKPGLVPGEMRTYEQRLRDNLESLQRRESAGIPSFTRLITNIHYARWFVLRPEQYLQYSKVPGVSYLEDAAALTPEERATTEAQANDTEEQVQSTLRRTPAPIDDFREVSNSIHHPEAEEERPEFVSWLIFTSNFDGDLKSYARNVAEFIGKDADRLWGNCYDYPGTADFEAWWLYARRHQIPTDVFYAAYPQLTVPRIQQLNTFKARFDEFVARTRNADGTSRQDIAVLFDEFLRDNLQYTNDFPASGGIYDTEQVQRTQDLRK